MNNENTNQLQQVIESLFSKYFYYDKQAPHTFFTKDITIHDPIFNLTSQIANLTSQLVEASLAAIKQQQEQAEKQQQEQDPQQEDNTEQQQDSPQDRSNILDSYYDYYYYNDVES